jgi:hypothetical protein
MKTFEGFDRESFSDNEFLGNLEAQQLHHTIGLRQTQPLQRALADAASNGHGWWQRKDEHDKVVAEIELTR